MIIGLTFLGIANLVGGCLLQIVVQAITVVSRQAAVALRGETLEQNVLIGRVVRLGRATSLVTMWSIGTSWTLWFGCLWPSVVMNVWP